MITSAQEDALKIAKKVLSEHFEGYVLVLETGVYDPQTKEEAFLWCGNYRGSNSLAIGLLEKYKHELIQHSISSTIRHRT